MAKRGRPKRVVPVKSIDDSAKKVTDDVDVGQSSSERINDAQKLQSENLGLDAEIDLVMDEAKIVGVAALQDTMISATKEQPFLRAVKIGVVNELDSVPDLVAGNRDTRRGCKLSNEEARDDELVFTLEDVAEERMYWSNALIGNVLECRLGKILLRPVGKPMALQRGATWTRKFGGLNQGKVSNNSVGGLNESTNRPGLEKKDEWQIVRRRSRDHPRSDNPGIAAKSPELNGLAGIGPAPCDSLQLQCGLQPMTSEASTSHDSRSLECQGIE
ncbi:hypothetical protein Dimus_031328 [Dionaea muscipula]